MLSEAALVWKDAPIPFFADVLVFCYVLNKTEHTP